MSADTATVFTPPETITVPASAVVTTLALLDAYAAVCLDLSSHSIDYFEALGVDDTWKLRDALGGGREDDEAFDGCFSITVKQARTFERSIRRLLDLGGEAFFVAKLRKDVVRLNRQLVDLGERVIGVRLDKQRDGWVYHYRAPITDAGTPDAS